nr:hypothetical protein BaRGS_024116 [Batillaria attramentaria]
MEEFMAYEKAFLEREENSGVCTSSQSATCRMECIPEEDEESEGEAGDGDVGPGQQLQPDRVCDMVLCKTYGKSKSSLSDISVEYSRADIVATQLTDVSVPDLSMSDTGMTGVWPCLNTEDQICGQGWRTGV